MNEYILKTKEFKELVAPLGIRKYGLRLKIPRLDNYMSLKKPIPTAYVLRIAANLNVDINAIAYKNPDYIAKSMNKVRTKQIGAVERSTSKPLVVKDCLADFVPLPKNSKSTNRSVIDNQCGCSPIGIEQMNGHIVIYLSEYVPLKSLIQGLTERGYLSANGGFSHE